MDKKLLEIRNEKKKKKPNFIRRDAHKKAKLEKKWHRPKGLHNKMRLHKKGYPKVISSGYKSPISIKGLTRQGFEPVVIRNLQELKSLDVVTQVAIISAQVGQKKKLELVKFALEKKIPMKNLKDGTKYIQLVEEEMKIRKEFKQSKLKSKQEREKEANKKVKEKEAEKVKKINEENKATPEEKIEYQKSQEKQEKKEQEKILTKKV